MATPVGGGSSNFLTAAAAAAGSAAGEAPQTPTSSYGLPLFSSAAGGLSNFPPANAAAGSGAGAAGPSPSLGLVATWKPQPDQPLFQSGFPAFTGAFPSFNTDGKDWAINLFLLATKGDSPLSL